MPILAPAYLFRSNNTWHLLIQTFIARFDAHLFGSKKGLASIHLGLTYPNYITVYVTIILRVQLRSSLKKTWQTRTLDSPKRKCASVWLHIWFAFVPFTPVCIWACPVCVWAHPVYIFTHLVCILTHLVRVLARSARIISKLHYCSLIFALILGSSDPSLKNLIYYMHLFALICKILSLLMMKPLWNWTHRMAG